MEKISNKYFRLFANCILVKGAKQSTICDLQLQRYIEIPNLIHDILLNNQNEKIPVNTLIKGKENNKVQQLIMYLIENEFGFTTDSPDVFPDISLEWDYPAIVTNAIIDLDNSSNYSIKNVGTQLMSLLCAAIQIRFFPPISDNEIFKALEIINNVTSDDLILELVLPYQTASKTEKIFEKSDKISKIIFGGCPTNKVEYDEKNMCEIIYSIPVIEDDTSCGNICKEMFICNEHLFTESLSYNNCLNRKISISKNGDVKNCPSIKKSYGHVNNVRLEDIILNKQFSALWHIKKDDITICKDCEFRYICTDCRAFTQNGLVNSKPEKCKYNPYIAEWE